MSSVPVRSAARAFKLTVSIASLCLCLLHAELKPSWLLQREDVDGTPAITARLRDTSETPLHCVFLTEDMLVEGVVNLDSGSLRERTAIQGSPFEGTLQITAIDTRERRVLAKREFSVSSPDIFLARSSGGNLVVVSSHWVKTLDLSLSDLETAFFESSVDHQAGLPSVDLVDEDLYVKSKSSVCGLNVVSIRLYDLSERENWCLPEGVSYAFLREAATGYYRNQKGPVKTFRSGSEVKTQDSATPTSFISFAMLTDQGTFVRDGNYIELRSSSSAGSYSRELLANFNALSDVSCSKGGPKCAILLARTRANLFDSARTTTYSKVELVEFDLRSGATLAQIPITSLSGVTERELRYASIISSPQGGRVAYLTRASWKILKIQ